MSVAIKREILVSILESTIENNNVREKDISKGARVPHELTKEILMKLHKEKLLKLEDADKIIVDSLQRLKIAEKAITLGADIERIARFLTWIEFESFSRSVFEANGFEVKKNLRFTWLKKRWEIDILGLKKPIIISADCKHWHKKWSGAASIRAAKNQIERTKALAEASRNMMNRIGISGWRHAYFIPVILSLSPSQYKFYKGTPIVPILQLKDFLEKVMIHLDEITSFHVSYPSLDDFK
ncbi:MAG TPA: hypothetical protein ENH03_03560 [Candidatus Bathyarchaeota archaeon]|nr:hypothetical protein [Candidatus Bathyarchaeota archaeon]